MNVTLSSRHQKVGCVVDCVIDCVVIGRLGTRVRLLQCYFQGCNPMEPKWSHAQERQIIRIIEITDWVLSPV